MNSEKRMIGDYKVILTAWLGDKEYLIGEASNDASEQHYMTCVNISNEIYTAHEDAVGSDDYLEIFKLYLDRLATRLRELETERSKRGITNMLTAEDCVNGGLNSDITGKVIIIKPETLPPEYRTADRQLQIANSGFGCCPNSRGNAVFCTNLYSGEKIRYEKHDVVGIADISCLPEWALQKLAEIKTAVKSSVIGQDGTFEFGGYHFKPERKFRKGEIEEPLENDSRPRKTDAQYAMRNMKSDRTLGLSTYEWQKADYSYEKFYAASGGSDCDLFRCVENGNLYVPGENELFLYTGR